MIAKSIGSVFIQRSSLLIHARKREAYALKCAAGIKIKEKRSQGYCAFKRRKGRSWTGHQPGPF